MDFPVVPQALDRLAAHLREGGRRYPQAWRQFDEFRARRKELGDWPAWCFCPVAGAYSIVSHQTGIDDLGVFARKGAWTGDERRDAASPMLDVGRLSALAPWRLTQGVYLVDPDVLDAVSATPLAGDVPVDVLMNLPEWCVYVATPNLTHEAGSIAGFFAHLEHDMKDGRTELRLLADFASDPPWVGLMGDIIHLVRGESLERCYGRMLDTMAANAARRDEDGEYIAEVRMTLLSTARERLTPLVSILLYLCSQTAEYREGGRPDFARPTYPEATKTKKGWRLFPPPAPRVWYVSERIGNAIRAGREAVRAHDAGERAGPRPHVRKSHWHTYWLGSRKEGRQRPELRWLPPIPVAMAEDTPEARMRAARPGRIKDLGTEVQTLTRELERRADGPGSRDTP